MSLIVSHFKLVRVRLWTVSRKNDVQSSPFSVIVIEVLQTPFQNNVIKVMNEAEYSIFFDGVGLSWFCRLPPPATFTKLSEGTPDDFLRAQIHFSQVASPEVAFSQFKDCLRKNGKLNVLCLSRPKRSDWQASSNPWRASTLETWLTFTSTASRQQRGASLSKNIMKGSFSP